MPALASDQLGAKFNDDLGQLAVHDHRFPSANSALSYWTGDKAGIDAHRKLLENSLRLDLFGLRTGGSIEGELIAPLPNQGASVVKGESYLIETVLRTLTLGHHFTQGTTDSNQVWIEFTATQDGEVIGKSGDRDARERVDEWSHFVNNFVVDREGNRINRRNAHDIFTKLYGHQIPPGAGQTVHYLLKVPTESDSPIEITARLLYRKFDTEYLDYIRADRDPERDPLDLGEVGAPNDLPIIEIARDQVTLDVTDQPVPLDEKWMTAEESDDERPIPTWQRWNDYGIGMLLRGKAELKQASEAFQKVGEFGRYDGPLNLARVQFAEGDLNGATQSLADSLEMDTKPPSWTHAWLSGSVSRQQGHLETAVKLLQGALDTRVPERGFDFSLDYAVRNELALTLFDLASKATVMDDQEAHKNYLDQSREEFERVLEIDSENATAHAMLVKIATEAGDDKMRAYHRRLHDRYKLDDNAAEIALPAARRKYPAANHAAQALVIYDLNRQ
jgi:tetratricopeptide (TPR) repeat protein